MKEKKKKKREEDDEEERVVLLYLKWSMRCQVAIGCILIVTVVCQKR